MSELRGNNEWVGGGGAVYNMMYTIHMHNGRGEAGIAYGFLYCMLGMYVCIYVCR